MQTRGESLDRAAALSGRLGTATLIPPSVLKASSIEPANGSTFMDAEHIVILMQ